MLCNHAVSVILSGEDPYGVLSPSIPKQEPRVRESLRELACATSSRMPYAIRRRLVDPERGRRLPGNGRLTPSQSHRSGDNIQGMLRVAVLDDHPAVLAGLQRLLDSTADLKAVAVADNAPQLLRELDSVGPDVVVLDYDLARGDGLTLCQTLKERVRPPAVVIYSAYAGAGLAISSRLAGADALVDKRAPASELIETIRRVAAGEPAITMSQPRYRRLRSRGSPRRRPRRVDAARRHVTSRHRRNARDRPSRRRSQRATHRRATATDGVCAGGRRRVLPSLPHEIRPAASRSPTARSARPASLTVTSSASPPCRPRTPHNEPRERTRPHGRGDASWSTAQPGVRQCRDGSPLNVLIAGGGRAGLEAMLRLHRVAGPQTQVTLLAPNEEFVNHALDAVLPFATSLHAPHTELKSLAAAGSAGLCRGRVCHDRGRRASRHHRRRRTDRLRHPAARDRSRAARADGRTPCASAATKATRRCTASSRTSRWATCERSRSSCPAARHGRWRSTSSR